MAQNAETLDEWLRTVNVPEQPRWAQLEYEITKRSRPPVSGAHVAMLACVLLVTAVFFCGPYLVLLLVALATSAGESLSGLAYGVAHAGAAIGAAEPLLAAMFWWEDKNRTIPRFVLTTGAAAAAGATYLLLRVMPETDDLGWLALLSLVTIAAGLVMTIILLFSKRDPYSRLPVRVRLRTMISPPNAIAFAEIRKSALHTLVGTGKLQAPDDVIERADRQPLGAWHRLDS